MTKNSFLDLTAISLAWFSKCSKPTACCGIWHNQVKKAISNHEVYIKDYNRKLNASDDYWKLGAYDFIEPVWNCETLERVPNAIGDGPKWMCGIDQLATTPEPIGKPLFYSFGSNGDASWEIAVTSAVPSLDMHTFDHTLDSDKRDRVKYVTHLHEVGVSRDVKSSSNTLPLLNIMASLNHTNRPISVLKMDIEFDEHYVFQDIVVGECSGADITVGQICIEFHGLNVHSNVDLMHKFMSCNMLLFSKERNGWGCATKGMIDCVEFSFIGPSQAFATFQATHPSCHGIVSHHEHRVKKTSKKERKKN